MVMSDGSIPLRPKPPAELRQGTGGFEKMMLKQHARHKAALPKTIAGKDAVRH
jgi:hypothetical protein